MPASAPVNSVRPNILDTAGIFYPLELGMCSLTSAGLLTAEIKFSGVPAAGLTTGAWTDENGVKLGFTFYISEPIKTIGGSVQNQFQQNLGFSQIIQSSTPPLATLKGFKLIDNMATLKANFKSFPSVGQIVLLTGCVVGDNGTISIFSSTYVTIT
jgi:hypothetical protein